jgi:DNA-directed RNA polymerase subunit RPC12/RpoP
MYNSIGDRHFEDTLRDGISAAKVGERQLAQTLLNRAVLMNGADSRPHLWLAATTDDPAEQREYLEKAVALDPNNVAARRGLALLTGRIDKSRLMPEGAAMAAQHPAQTLQVEARSFVCPQCGGRLAYSVMRERIACEYCGYVEIDEAPMGESGQSLYSVADRAEQTLDFVMPTTRGHRWAEAQHLLVCERCGANSILPAGAKSAQCAYCGSNQLVESPEHGELVDPQVIATFKVDEKEAVRRAREWIGKGLFSPDNLVSAMRGLRLRPAYTSCWTFDGVVEVRWACEVREGSGRSETWLPRSGTDMELFNDVLVPGVKALSQRQLASIEPFDLKDVEEFKPEHLAGWPAMIYDRSLAEASLLGRERVINRLRPQISGRVEVGQEKRNLSIGSGNWSGMTFKHVLLPLWMGAYVFRGKRYEFMVNGQTGKVGGQKPRDSFKIAAATLTAVLFVFVLLALYWLLSSPGGMF